MNFAQYEYQEFNNQNKALHPISDWCKMVNDNYEYCKNWNTTKEFQFKIALFLGLVKPIDLPSFHPYWKEQIKQRLELDLKKLMSIFESCKQDNSKIKILFNSTTSIKDIELKIKELKLKIDSL